MPGPSRAARRIVDECATDAMSHRVWFDEEVVEFGVVPCGSPGGESEEMAAGIDRDADAAGGECAHVDAEDAGVGVEVGPVLGPDV